MQEELLANMMFSPTIIALIAVAGLVCFFFGWTCKGFGSNKRESELKRDIIESKRAIPQLESSVHTRDLQIARLEQEVSDLSDKSTGLHRELNTREQDLRSKTREVRNLSSELAAVKGVSRDDPHGLISDDLDFGDTADDSPDAKLANRLKRSEALYDKLKDGLLARDHRIDELEEQLASQQPTAGHPRGEAGSDADDLAGEIDALRCEISEQSQTIERLQTEARELHQEKEMLEELAKRRSESNRALKTVSAEIESKMPEMEARIGERNKTIANREASIKRLLNDLEQSKKEKSELTDTFGKQKAVLEKQAAELSRHTEQVTSLETSLESREQRIGALDQELELLQTSMTRMQDDVRRHMGEIEGLNTRLVDAKSQSERRESDHAQKVESLQSALADRNFKLASITADHEELNVALDEAKAKSASQLAKADSEKAELTASASELDARNRALIREVDDLRETLKLHERWLAKMKDSLAERDSQIVLLGSRLQVREAAVHAAEQKLSDVEGTVSAQLARDTANTEKVSSLEARIHQSETEATARAEAMKTQQEESTQRAEELSCVTEQLRDLNARLDSERQALTKARTQREEFAARVFELEKRTDQSPRNVPTPIQLIALGSVKTRRRPMRAARRLTQTKQHKLAKPSRRVQDVLRGHHPGSRPESRSRKGAQRSAHRRARRNLGSE